MPGGEKMKIRTAIIMSLVVFTCGCKAGQYNIAMLWKDENQIKLSESVNASEYENATNIIVANPKLLESKDEETKTAVEKILNWNYVSIKENSGKLIAESNSLKSSKAETWKRVDSWSGEAQQLMLRYERLPQKEDVEDVIKALAATVENVYRYYNDNAAAIIGEKCLNVADITGYPQSESIPVQYSGLVDIVHKNKSSDYRARCYLNIQKVFAEKLASSELLAIKARYIQEKKASTKNATLVDAHKSLSSYDESFKEVIPWSKVFIVSNGQDQIKVRSPIKYERISSLNDRGRNADNTLAIVPIGTRAFNIKSTERKVESKYISHKVTEPNPEYDRAVMAYNAAMQKYNYASSQYQSNQLQQAFTVDPWARLGNSIAGIGIAASLGNAKNELVSAQSTLSSTPRVIERPVHAEYNYTVQDVQKRIVSTVYIVSRENGIDYTYKSIHESERSFSVPFGLNKSDTSSFVKYDDAKSIEEFVSGPRTFALSEILSKAEKASGVEKPDHIKVAKSDKKTNESLSETTQHATPVDSVVIIASESNAFGAGFYVTDDLILTNAHVVQAGSSVSIKNSAGTSGLGVVLKSDSILDLALVRTELKGRPVTLAGGKVKFGQGDEVQAVGHPKGLTFSVSRGVVSAFREVAHPLNPGKKVKYIQTDAAISPGNSGGPLLVKGKVVGINTFKLVDKQVEGLGFAVHYDTIKDFISVK